MRAARTIAIILLGAVPLAGCQQHVPATPAAAAASLDVAQGSPIAETPMTPAGPLAVTWNDLDVGIQAESRFEPWMMKTSIRSLEGQSVRITGFMHGGVAVKEGIREFILLRNIDCPYGRQGEAHHVIVVKLAGDLRTSYSPQAITVEGTFHVRPFDGPDGTTWSLYALDEARVSASGPGAALPDSIHNQEGENAP